MVLSSTTLRAAIDAASGARAKRRGFCEVDKMSEIPRGCEVAVILPLQGVFRIDTGVA